MTRIEELEREIELTKELIELRKQLNIPCVPFIPTPFIPSTYPPIYKKWQYTGDPTYISNPTYTMNHSAPYSLDKDDNMLISYSYK